MKRLVLVIIVMMVACLALSPVMAKQKKKKEDKKESKEKAGPPKLSASHSQGVDEKSGEMVHTVSVKASGASGMLFAIYKLPNGSRYTCMTQPIGSEKEKKGKSKKKGKKTKGKKKSKDNKKDKDKATSKTFTFPHKNGEGKFVDYVAVLLNDGKVLSKTSNSPMWLSSIEKLIENSASTFNSKGEPVDEETVSGHAGLSDEDVMSGVRMRNAMEVARKNQEMMDDVNKKPAE